MDREIEGTWEEILSHAEELAGHTGKVIVLMNHKPCTKPGCGQPV